MNLWLHITAIGDAKLMLPAAAVIVLWLLAARAWAPAAIWAASFGMACAAVVATKLAFIGWGIGIRAVDFTGISGHAMRSAAVIPVFACLVSQPLMKMAAKLAIGAGYFSAAMVAASRVMLDAHSLSEVTAGFALGGAISLAFISRTQARSAVHISGTNVTAGLFVLAATMFLEPAPTKIWVKDTALELSGRHEPVRRHDRTW